MDKEVIQVNKIYKVFCAALLLMAFIGNVSADTEASMIKQNLKNTKFEANDFNDSRAFSIVYTGTGTTCALSISSRALVIDSLATVDDVASIDFGDAAYDTIGEVFDYLNSFAYTCTATDMRRADNSNLLAVISAQSILSTDDLYSVSFDTAGITATTAYFMSIRLEPDYNKSIVIDEISCEADVSSAANLWIYIEDYSATTQWSEKAESGPVRTLANGTVTTPLFTYNDPLGGLKFDPGDVVVIRASGDTTQATPSYLAVRSRVLDY